MRAQLSDHFTYRKLFRYVMPSVITMIFTSIYNIVDGFFISNFAGKTAFAAVNLIMPLLMLLSTFGFMFGTGGSAIVARLLGEKRRKEADQAFSLLVWSILAVGTVLMLIGQIFLPAIARRMGADDAMYDTCIIYARINLCSTPFFTLQVAFQSFCNAAEKPRLGLVLTVFTGVANMILDGLFVGVFSWGAPGAALATTICECLGGILPLIYFARRNTSLLRLLPPGRVRFHLKLLLEACGNGSSEFLTMMSRSMINILYNWQLMRFIGRDGVAAFGAILYLGFIFSAVFMGYSLGSSAIVSYNYGAQNHPELRNIFRKSMAVLAGASLSMFGLAQILAYPMCRFYAGYDPGLFRLMIHAFRVYAFVYLLTGWNGFGSAFFTALGNGRVSAIISFLRTLVFQIAAVLLLPALLGAEGIWNANTAAEVLSLTVTAFFLVRYRHVYHYVQK